MKRIVKELEKVRELYDAECVGDNAYLWQIALPGPDHTPYFGGTFVVRLVFPEDYPFHAPDVRFETKIYHPNINHLGETCIGIIKNDWKPSVTAMDVILGVLQLLREPNADDPLVPEIAKIYKNDNTLYNSNAEEWTHKYAML